ncbi:(S)-citramalyl-CoA lyase [Thermoflexales bacterium]|nr:(S)-citramalyl-CoA lyase [Thermoflexales bacterium]
MRPRRCLLFMPGDDLKKIQKGIRLGVDAIVMDLEDGVALKRKAEARATIATALRDLPFGRSERVVRINPIGSGLEQADLDAVLPQRPDSILLPKVEHAGHIQWLAETIADPSVRVLALIETARGVVNLREIAAASDRLDALIFGAEDLAGDIGATRTQAGWEVFYARSAVVTHAAACGLQAIDTLVIDFNDEAALIEDARLGAQLGFSGKLAIHPRQVDVIQAIFTPSDEQIAQAQRLILVHEEQQAQGSGAFAFEGKMIDRPAIRAAQQVITKAQAAGKIPRNP